MAKKTTYDLEPNQNPEQVARDEIDRKLAAAGWRVQSQKQLNFNDGAGQAIREFPTDAGPADYVLFLDRKPVGVIEAKRPKTAQNITNAEDQTRKYAHAKLKWTTNTKPLPFLYQSTGIVTKFTDGRDPKPRSREVFSFHRPETLKAWMAQGVPLRTRLHKDLPPLNPKGVPAKELRLRDCQETAIQNLEQSFREFRPRALIQMATGSGKTYTAITAMYRLLKHADVGRILFLVDTRNLGEQAEQEMMAYVTLDDNRKFSELYAVQRLQSPFVAPDSQVVISTIQRMYSVLKGQDLDPALEEMNPAERLTKPKQPVPVEYNAAIPPEFFDFIIIDECHRSIYNDWRQVLDYFDAFLIGLTATPDKRTYGFFNKNVVSHYDHEKAVADGVNVGNEIYVIETEVTRRGGKLKAKLQYERREKLTRQKRWEQQDEDAAYAAKQLDKDIVNPDQIRTVIRSFRNSLPEIFPRRDEVPKMLIFAKNDSHADDIIQVVREEFGEGNDFCKKVTYKSEDDPKSVLARFRNGYHPRIAVTVDMIATGTDVKPLECLLFMRDVKSRNYFEQMKGRGTRTLGHDDLKKVTPSAASAKTHYVIVDAVGVTKSRKTDSQPMDKKPTVPLKDLAMGVMMGANDEDVVSSLAGRLARLNHQLDEADRKKIREASGNTDLTTIVKGLLAAIEPDNIFDKALEISGTPEGQEPDEESQNKARAALVGAAAKVFSGELVDVIDGIRRQKEQIIDHENLDSVIRAEWDEQAEANGQALVDEFRAYLEEHRDEIDALSIFYGEPHRRREMTYDMIRELLERLKADKPNLAPLRVWSAFERLEGYKGKQPVNELTALVAVVRRVCGIDDSLSTYDATVRSNFKRWIMGRHSGAGKKFNEEQMEWLRMIRDHVITSFAFERDDLEIAPFDGKGGLGRMYELFGDEMDELIGEMNGELAA